jgi:hypothetical protein
MSQLNINDYYDDNDEDKDETRTKTIPKRDTCSYRIRGRMNDITIPDGIQNQQHIINKGRTTAIITIGDGPSLLLVMAIMTYYYLLRFRLMI